MKSKKLLTLIIAVVVVIVIIIVLASAFSVKQALPVYHNFEGGEIITPEEAPTRNQILELTKGKSIIFLSKEKVLDQLNTLYPEWHAIGIVKNFPNILEVHFVKRVAIVKVNIDGGFIYLDSFGYVVDAPTDGSEPMDISSAMDKSYSVIKSGKGEKLLFDSDVANDRLSYVLQSIMALWQCKCEIANIPTILGKKNVFTFQSNGYLVITTSAGAQIVVMSPEKDLTQNLIKAFSVYCDGTRDLQVPGTVISVYPDGKVTTPGGKAQK